VTAPRRLVDGRERVTLNTAYVRALESAGLVPLAVPTMLAPERAGAALDAVRGLVLTGGEDVAPDRYGATPHPRLGDVDPGRDAAELALIAAARARRVPILFAASRSRTWPSAAPLSGPDSERPDPPPTATKQPARVCFRLAARAHAGHRAHRRAIQNLRRGLKAVAWAEDGVIEAAEPPTTAP
jgi:putative glutamine amidotransferase